MMDLLRKSSAHVFINSLASPVLEQDDAHHLLKVLRITEHDVVSVCDGRGSWITAKLDKHGELHPLSEVFTSAPRKNLLSVAFAPVKGEKPEVIVQKLTELGIDQIIPLAPTRRSVVKWDDARADVGTCALESWSLFQRNSTMPSANCCVSSQKVVVSRLHPMMAA